MPIRLLQPKIRAVDKHNLRYLLSNIPTKQNGNSAITKINCPLGSFSDMRGIGGETTITIGKSELEVSHLNGKVLSYKKPFYKSLKKLINKASELLNYVNTNFKNSEKVKKTTVEFLTFSKSSIQKLQK